MRYIALLRGINVGGHVLLPMADLRRLLAELGHAEVSTYLQSGNALFTSARPDRAALVEEIEAAITAHLGRPVAVLLRTPDELAAVVAGNPFPDAVATPTRLHVAFLSAQPDPERLAAIDVARFAPDEFRPGEGVIYLYYPNGSGRSKLTGETFARLGVQVTARNWNTVTALLSLSSE